MAEDSARAGGNFEEIDRRLGPEVRPYVDVEPPPAPGTRSFEIGLVLAGAVSAGAYSAGVMDFLIEALDAWEHAKKDGKPVPEHNVRIRVMAGASAGSMTAAIAAATLKYDFPHIRPQPVPGTSDVAPCPIQSKNTGNPFYDAWVREIDIKNLLQSNDLTGPSPVLQSLLDSSVLQSITDAALDIGNLPGIQTLPRPYLGDHVRFIFTQGGLRGIPYFIPMRGPNNAGLSMNLHKSFRSFSVSYTSASTDQPIPRRPDDVPLHANIPQKTTNKDWRTLGNAALGSGAFPVGLIPRFEQRPVEELFYRFVVVPGDIPELDARQHVVANAAPNAAPTVALAGTVATTQVTRAMRLFPNVPPPLPATYDEFVVDGGTMDNEPLDMARTEMAGLIGANERDGEKASRAVIMIDPFANAFTQRPPPPAPGPLNLIASAFGLIDAWKSQARFDPVDLALAWEGSVYSRFLVSPSPETRSTAGAQGIASGSLGGFGGFLNMEFRHHDYLLGRRNCQQFLREHFSLPAANLLFQDPDGVLAPYQQRTSTGEIRVIPLVDHASISEPMPDWPTTPVDLNTLGNQIDARLGNVTAAALNMLSLNGFSAWVAGIGVVFLRRKAKGMIVSLIQKDLDAHKLETIGPSTTLWERIFK